MLIPAIKYQKEITEWSDILRYSTNMMFYNGCNEHGRIQITDDWDGGGRYQWAIVDRAGRLVGYIAYDVDHHAHTAYSFGLIKFSPDPADTIWMAWGILDAIHHLMTMDLHRIEFRCVGDNPAYFKYRNIVDRMSDKYKINDFELTDVFRDESGRYHNMDIFELIRRELPWES